MKTIYRLAKAELSNMFYSPVAWLILVIFAFQAGMAFSEGYTGILKNQALGHTMNDITNYLYSQYSGLYVKMVKTLYLYIPLLTMGLMSREYSSGSIKLLFSSPVTNTQIILGKYTAMLVYGLALVAVLLIYVVFGAVTIENADVPFMLSGLLAIYLLICAYSAIGLFMSSLTSYQVVAAMGTLAVLAVFNFIGEIGQDWAFVRELTYWLAMSGRSWELLSGMICSEDVLYFIVVVALFISLSVLRLESERRKRSVWAATGRYVTVVVLALTVGYISSRPSMKFYYDASANKVNTLTPASQQVVKQLEGRLKVTTYVNLLEENFLSAIPRRLKEDFNHLKRYVRFKPEMQLEYVYYYDQVENPSLERRYPGLSDREKAEKLAKVYDLSFGMFLSPEQIRETIDLSPEGNRFVRLIERENGQKAFLRVYNDMQKFPSETEITAALKRLIVKAPRVAFITGHGERSIERIGDQDYSTFARDKHFRHSLINQGFDVVGIDLAAEDIPSGIDIVVIADVKNKWGEAEKQKLDHYIQRGGNLLIAGEPGRSEFMNPLVERFGVRFMSGTLVQTNRDFLPSLIVAGITPEAGTLSSKYDLLRSYGYRMVFPGAVGLECTTDKGFEVLPLMQSRDTASWNELETTDFLDGKISVNPSIGEVEKSYPLALALSRKVGDKEQRIVVLGDSDCISNGELGKERNGIHAANFSLITESFRWFSYGEYPVDTERPLPMDRKIDMSRKASGWIKGIAMGIIPAGLLLCSIVLWMRRRRR